LTLLTTNHSAFVHPSSCVASIMLSLSTSAQVIVSGRIGLVTVWNALSHPKMTEFKAHRNLGACGRRPAGRDWFHWQQSLHPSALIPVSAYHHNGWIRESQRTKPAPTASQTQSCRSSASAVWAPLETWPWPHMPRSPQDIYARHLLSRRGYPLWMPEPSHQLLVYRRDGLRIGDVGVVIPEDGCFDVFFNLCLPQDHPFHRANGVPDNFKPIELSDTDIRTAVDVENPGRIIANSSVKSVRAVERPADSSSGCVIRFPRRRRRLTFLTITLQDSTISTGI